MTPKTFWTFFLKIFGVYITWQVLIMFPSALSVLVYMLRSDDKIPLFSVICVIVMVVCTFALILRTCLFRADFVIEKLRLTKGFDDEKLDINIHRSSLLTIATIVIGGLMLADALPALALNAFQYIQRDNTYADFGRNPTSPLLIFNFLKIAIGYFMVADSRLIVNFIERKRRKAKISGEETEA